MNFVTKALNVIRYTKLNKTSYTGHKFDAGYHSFVLDGQQFQGARDGEKRMSNVVGFDFLNKNVLDIGCNMGGVLHSLCSKISYGVGIDVDPKCINAANVVKRVNKIDNLDFYVFNLDVEDLNFINNLWMSEKIDICLFLSVSQHIKKWKDVINFCFNISNCLLFESNGKWHFQDMQLDFVKGLYREVIPLGVDGRRRMFLCNK